MEAMIQVGTKEDQDMDPELVLLQNIPLIKPLTVQELPNMSSEPFIQLLELFYNHFSQSIQNVNEKQVKWIKNHNEKRVIQKKMDHVCDKWMGKKRHNEDELKQDLSKIQNQLQTTRQSIHSILGTLSDMQAKLPPEKQLIHQKSKYPLLSQYIG